MRAGSACALLMATAAWTSAAPLVEFGASGVPGVVEGSSLGPDRASCSSADALFESNRTAAASVVETTGPRAARVLRLATGLPALGDDLAQTRWRLPFEAPELSRLTLTVALRTSDDAAFGDWFLVMVDGAPIACGEASALSLSPVPGAAGVRTSAWLDVGDALVQPGSHSLEVVVGDGTDSTGLSELLVSSVQLEAFVPTPCRPHPPEDVGEVVWEGSTDPFGQTWGGSTPTLWTFDDNRFCPEGPGLACNRPQDLNGDGSIDSWESVNPNDGSAFVDATGTVFEMYVVADCGTEMHVPLFDVESGTISVRDPAGDLVLINVTNGAGFNQTGLQVSWHADFCDGFNGSDFNAPGGPGNETVMDVSFQGTPTLCGVYTVEFTSWGGCIWDLFANCDGSDSEQFSIYDDKCEAALAVHPLPELIVDDLRLSQGTGCSVNYCVDYRNIGCATALPSTVRVSNQFGSFNHVVGPLDAGETVTLCGSLAVIGTGNVSTQVLAAADFGDAVDECSEEPDASSCDPATGGDFVQKTILVACANPPTCDAGGPYSATCTAASGSTLVVLDGTGSFDPDGGALEYAWTTTCLGGAFNDSTSAQPVLSSTHGGCQVCSVTLTIRDDEGSTASCSATVTITDTTPPSVTCPPDVAVECSNELADRDEWMALAEATDGCDSDVAIQETLVGFNEPCVGSSSEVWRFRATDGCGNSAQCDARWDVVDLVPPVITPPPPRQVECGSVSPTDLILWLLEAEGEDACTGPVTVLNELVDVQAGCGGTEIRTYRFHASDPCGNQAETTSTYSTVDTTNPELDGVPPSAEADCDEVPPAAVVTADDSCDPDVAVVPGESRIDGACPDTYTLVRTWTAVDDCGNDVTATQNIDVADDEPPTLAGVPGNLLAPCDDVPEAPPVTAIDACDPDPDVTYLETRADGACPDSYVLTRTWTAEDRCGNVASAVRTVTVTDTEPPQLQGVPLGGTVECGQVPVAPEVTATDNCDPDPDVDSVEVVTPGDCAGEATIVRTWTATDRCFRQVVAMQVLFVRDTTAPQLLAPPGDSIAECDEVPDAADVQAADACDPEPDVELDEVRTDGDCEDEYVLVRTWTATDDCGNSSEHVQTVTVQDTTDPQLAGVPANAVADCDDVPDAASPTATDNCDPDPDVDFDEERIDGSCPDSYQLVRTWTATDRCGRSATASQVISVHDDEPPTLAGVPASAVADCDDVPGAASPTASDDCDPDPDVDFDEERIDGSCPDSYQLVRTWTATDRCDNAATATQTITVQDVTDPELHGVPANAVADCDDVPEAASPTATDNCDPAPQVGFGEQRIDGACPDSYELVRTWTATDRCGNSTAASQTITVQDVTDPELHGAPANETAECDDVPEAASPTATDNCDPAPKVELDEQRVDGDCPGEYLLLRTWTATDRCGNSSSATQAVTVLDTQPPMVTPNPEDQACIWPPNHWYVCFGREQFEPLVQDACSDPVTWRFVGCASDQPDDAPERGAAGDWNGDGAFINDCVVAPDGSGFCVRAERCGTGPNAQAGRHYGVAIVATDACDNSTGPIVIGTLHVPHDQSPRERGCIKSTHEGLRPNEPLPWGTTRPPRR